MELFWSIAPTANMVSHFPTLSVIPGEPFGPVGSTGPVAVGGARVTGPVGSTDGEGDKNKAAVVIVDGSEGETASMDSMASSEGI